MLAIPDHSLPSAASDILMPQGRVDVWASGHRRPVSYHFKGREVRSASREVWVDGVRRKLQPRAFDLLVYLIEHRNRVLSIDELLDAIWLDQEVQVGSLATAIARIRSVLGESARGSEMIVQTHHRVGYRFVAALACDPCVAS